MADSKITALTSISTSTDPAVDPLVIVDVSDTSMAATGTTKKVTLNQLLGSGGTATLASATITGDLTAARLIVTGGTIPANGLWLPTTNTLEFAANSLAQYRIAPLGVFSWYDGAGGTRMTLNSTGLGVGVTPSAGKGALQLSSGINFPATQVASSDVNTLDDYKEAAFTPTIEGGTIAGIGTYSSQVGRYTKVGNLVTVQILIAWTAHTGTGNLSIANLPYTSSSVSGLVASATIGYVDGLALTAGNTPLAYIQNNSSKISLLQTPTGGGSVSLVPMDTAATIAINVTYMV